MNHIAGLLHLLSRLIVSVVKELGGVAVEIHRIAFGEQLILYFGHVFLGHGNGIQAFIVQEGAHIHNRWSFLCDF